MGSNDGKEGTRRAGTIERRLTAAGDSVLE